MTPSSMESTLPVRDRLFGELMARSKALLDEPSRRTIADYRDYLNRLTANFLRPIAKFVVYPLQIIISNAPEFASKCQVPTSCEQMLLDALDCLDVALAKMAPLPDSATFDVCFTLMITLLDHNVLEEGESKLPPLGEDTRLALLRYLRTLFVACDQAVFNARFQQDEKFKYKLGFFINLLLNLTKKPQQYFKIQQAALDLLSVFYLKSISQFFDASDHCKVAIDAGTMKAHATAIQFTAFTLPSVASTVQKLIKVCSGGGNHYKLHSTVIEASLRLLAIVLQITFNPGQTFSEEENTDLDNSKAPDDTAKTAEVNFTQSWFDETTDRLGHILRPICDTLLDHPGLSVQAVLQEVAFSLILNTGSKFMLKFADILIRVPIVHIEEPQSAQFIEQFRKQTAALPETEFNQLRSLLEGELLAHITVLSRGDSAELLETSFKTLSGFLQILDPDSLFHLFFLIDQHKSRLFRALIRLSQFDYSKRLQQGSIEDLDDIDSSPPNQLPETDLFDLLELDQHLLHLRSAPLVRAYLKCTRRLAANQRSFHIIYDHLLQLLHDSHFEPAILLLLNALLSALPQQNATNCRHYIADVLKLYCMHLDMSRLHHIDEEQQANDSLKPISIGELAAICAPPNLLNKAASDEPALPTHGKSEKRFVYQQCLLLQGITVVNALLHSIDSRQQTDFFRRQFCYFLEAYSSDIQLIASVAKRLLRWLSIKFSCGNGNVAMMVLLNLDYLYSSLTVALGYDILARTKENKYGDGLDVAMFRVDEYSLRTVQVSLETILRLLAQLHRSTGVVDSAQLDYLHRLMDQILNIVKYYSIRPLPRYAASLNHLLTILYAYLELIEVVCDPTASEGSRRIEEQEQEEASYAEAKRAVASLDEYTTNFQFVLEQAKMEFANDDLGSFEDVDENELPMEEEEQRAEKEKQAIIESPLVKSRAANVLHECSFLLSDASVEVRLNVLRLAGKSMKLLRAFEDLLLPYVHKLWEPLVARFKVESDHPLILSRAYSCLLLASEFCGDFLLLRTRREILPQVASFLHNQLDHRIAYFTTNRRLLTIKSVEYFAEHELLRSLGQLASNLKLRSRDLWPLCPLLILYASIRAIPPELRQCAFESLVQLARYDTGSLRFYLHRLRRLYIDVKSSTEETPACPDCQRVVPSLEECTLKWRRYFQPWDDSLLCDLNRYLDAL